MNKPIPVEIDHENGIRHDNRWSNLRDRTHQQNRQNRGAQYNSTSSYPGVSWKERNQKWVAQINIDGRRKHLGLFTTEESAYSAYLNAADKHGIAVRRLAQPEPTETMMIDDNEGLPSILSFSEDIADAEAPEPLPVGEYVGQIIATEVRMSQRDTKYVAVTFSIAPDEYPADYDMANAPDGKQVVYRRVSAEDDRQSRFRMRQFCEAIGAAMSKQINPQDWLGLEARLTIEHDEYEGVNRENITRVNPV